MSVAKDCNRCTYYSYAKLSRYDLGVVRLLGPGLGNLLFPWARFIVSTKKQDLIPIAPTWSQVKIGPLLRNEVDKRFYTDMFTTPIGQISGWKKLYLLSTLSRISEAECIAEKSRKSGRKLVIFEGSEGYFSSILNEHELIKEELLKMTLDKHKIGLAHPRGAFISVHVRLGDFSEPQTIDTLLEGEVDYRIPLSWYVQIINQIRFRLSSDLPVYVFSDGTEEELSELLSLPNSETRGYGSSIADLLALTCSHLLITSGSTFSMWASYMGRMPVIWHKGQLRQRLYYEKPMAEVESLGNDKIPESFFCHLPSF